MNGDQDHFSVGIEQSDGVWPVPPRAWSYSSLREATECPRRWALSRASYPDLWSQRGYPPRPILPALIGDVVHGVLEILIRTFRERGCTSLFDPEVVAVLKQLGGYTKLAEQGIDEQLERLTGNPRIGPDRIEPLRMALRVKVPEIRQRVQALITRSHFTAVTPSGDASAGGRGGLAPGVYPEVEVRAADIRLMGRADLLAITESECEIRDYKTGCPEPHHVDQVSLYALIWTRDRELNPESRPATRLVLAYPAQDVEVAPPSPTELQELARETSVEVETAESNLMKRPPPAFPEPSMCGLCDVRQLCDKYWMSNARWTVDDNQAAPDWFDIEGTVTACNGARSWRVAGVGTPDLLLRTSSEVVPFGVGKRIRIVNLRREHDEESSIPIGVLTSASEVFVFQPTG